MTSYKKNKSNNKVKNVKRGAYIKYRQYIQGYSLNDIAVELNISNAAVYRSIYGLSKISRVDEWLEDAGIFDETVHSDAMTGAA